jgi:2-polyprenyl-3-methyl-5-hydroxy-6-metoxy-1,4-benzoquinol methylase
MYELEKIAKEYHLAPQSDMFIENICQEFELNWVKQNIEAGSSVLELGYGDGVTFRSLSSHCDLSVVDGSKLIVAEARRVSKKLNIDAEIYESFFENFEPTKRFDVVFASHVLEHVQNPKLILEKFEQWLKPGGKVIVIVPNSESIHRRLAVYMGVQPALDTLSKRDHLVGHLRVFNLHQLTTLFLDAKWSIESSRGFFFKPLANSQLEQFEELLIKAMCKLSDDLPTQMCANIALVAVMKSI